MAANMDKLKNNADNANIEAGFLDEELATAGTDINMPVHGEGLRDVELSEGHGIFSRIQRYVGSIGVEKRGIERVPDTMEERTDTSMSKVSTMVSTRLRHLQSLPSNGLTAFFSFQFASSAMAVACFAVGTLSQPVFGLGFVDAMLVILFFNILGVIPTAFFSTFGPVFGLRQLVLSRFFFGWYGVKVCKCLTCTVL